MRIVYSCLCLLVCVSWASRIAAAEPPRPNIVMFYVDDMGWGSIGPNGQAERRANKLPYVRTPNLDRLATEGVNFTRGYGCTVCSPARSSLQTGFHQGHTFADRNDPDNAKKAIRADDPSIGKSLSAAGYLTGYWGKWGYGGSKDQRSPVLENLQTLPTSHGYEFVLAELHHVRAHTFFQPTLWHAPAEVKTPGDLELVPNSLRAYQARSDWPAAPALQDHPQYPSTAYCDDAYAFAALEFVRRQGQHYQRTGQPFHALLAVQIPHAPFGEITKLPEWNAAYADDPQFSSLAEQTRQWAAMVTRIDAHFGNILAALEDPNGDGNTADSIADETLVIFKSDNGGPGGMSHKELDTNGGLSGNKGSILEGGIRVPFIMRWPAMIHQDSQLQAGTSSNLTVDVTDLLPTFCELAGVPIPVGIDGVSLAPTLTGEGYQRPREFLIHEAGNQHSIICGKHKLISSRKNAPLKLYDLQADPGETRNVAAEHPKLVQELESLLLGEQVDQPKGFANTYHRWTGKDGARTGEADNWSDYTYSNAGITYLEDDGLPRPSWIARIVNETSTPNTARATSDMAVLGLEIQGNAVEGIEQTLRLAPGVQLVGRNEIRIGNQGTLVVNGGSVSSLRWVDVLPGGKLFGNGEVAATVFNSGMLTIADSVVPRSTITGDYHQSASGALRLTLDGANVPSLEIKGVAKLAGPLEVVLAEDFAPDRSAAFTILSAAGISGRFSNPGDEVTTGNCRFAIRYSENRVRLVMQ